MTNYNERLDDVLAKHGAEPGEMTYSLKQAITSLTKELVAEAKPGIHPYFDNEIDDGYAQTIYGAGILNYQNNLLKALEEV